MQKPIKIPIFYLGIIPLLLLIFLLCNCVSSLKPNTNQTTNTTITTPDLNNDITTLRNINHNLIAENEELKSKLESINKPTCPVCTDERFSDLAFAAQGSADRVNSRIPIVWEDKGYLVQIHPDSQVGIEIEKLLADSVSTEMNSFSTVKVQKINNRTYFFTWK